MEETTAQISEKVQRHRKEEEEGEGEAKCGSDNGTDRARIRKYRAMEVVQTRSRSIGQAN